MANILNYFSIYSNNDIKVPKLLPRDFEYLTSRILYNIDEIINYNRSVNIYVKRPNIFISLLNTISLMITDDIFETYDNLIDVYVNIASNFNFTTTKNVGKNFNSVILNGIDEFFLLEENSDINLIDFEDKWINYESIKLISTDNETLFFNNPYRTTLPYTNFAVYKVDVIGLTLQYYLWYKNQIKRNEDTDIALFLHQIPFNNLLNSFVERTLANIYLTGNEINVNYNREDGNLVNIDNYLEKVKKEWSTILNKHRYRDYFDFTKRFYPLTKNLYELNKIITIINSQNEWLYLFSILNNVLYFIDYIKKDKLFTNSLLTEIKEFERKNIKLPNISKFYLGNTISSIKEKIND